MMINSVEIKITPQQYIEISEKATILKIDRASNGEYKIYYTGEEVNSLSKRSIVMFEDGSYMPIGKVTYNYIGTVSVYPPSTYTKDKQNKDVVTKESFQPITSHVFEEIRL